MKHKSESPASGMKPCPFCGSENLRLECSSSAYSVNCNECDCYGPIDPKAQDPYNDLDAAIAAWNRALRPETADEPHTAKAIISGGKVGETYSLPPLVPGETAHIHLDPRLASIE